MNIRRRVPRGSRLWRALDGAVLWQLGHIPVAPATEDAFEWNDIASFWESSTVAAPPLPWTRPVRTRRDGVRVVQLLGRSQGPGGHIGSRRFEGRAYLHPSGTRAPLVLLLHGYAAPVPYYEDHHARLLLRRGVSAARIDLPFHMSRRSPGQGPGGGFFSTDPRRTAAVFRQATEDAAAVIAWARSEVTPRVAVLGFSLGGMVACLLAATTRLDAVVAVTPPCDLVGTVLERSPRRIRRNLGLIGDGGGPWGDDLSAARAVLAQAMAPVTPALLIPVTPADRITLVAAEDDLIVGADPVRELARTWGANLIDHPRGHVSVMATRGITARLHDRLLGDAIRPWVVQDVAPATWPRAAAVTP
jgi:dienelactone hydrolase